MSGQDSFLSLTAPDGDLLGRLFQSIGRRDDLSARERARLLAVIGNGRSVPAGTTLVRAHTPIHECTLLLDGYVSRQYDLASGRREIIALHVAGDFLDLHSMPLKMLDHDVVALTPARLATASHARIRELTETEPHLTRLFWFLTAVDGAIHRQWIAAQSKSAAARVAHLFCELQFRLALVGIGSASDFPLPLTQIDIADMTSLTPVHLNRTLRKLREAQLAEMRAGRVWIADLGRLRSFADFDPSYLYASRMFREENAA